MKENLYFTQERNKKYLESIKNRSYTVEKILKDDHRSFVALIQIENERVIYKVPKEKNSKKWQRFLSIFRGSESKREFFIGRKILDSGFNGATPILAWEKIENFMAVDSFYLMSYIDSHSAKIEEAELVAEELKKIHKKGLLHGDSHLQNFMIKDKKVYLIDCKLEKNRFGKMSELLEFINLEDSCYCKFRGKLEEISQCSEKNWRYNFLKKLNRLKDSFNLFTKKIRKK